MRKFTTSSAQSAVTTVLAYARHNHEASVAFIRQPFSYFLRSKTHPACGRVGARFSGDDRFFTLSVKGHRYSTAPNRKNYYEILRVSSKATQLQIKDAYYKQSMKHHPDKHKGSDTAHDMFQEITQAYSILGNHDLRKQYDRGLIVSGEMTTGDHTEAGQAPQKPSGSIYDFDEWTKQHYFAALKRKQRSMKERADEERERNSQKLRVGSQRWIILGVFCLAIAVAIVLERKVNNADEDTTE